MVVTPAKARRNQIASALITLGLLFFLILFASVRAANATQLWGIYFPVLLVVGLLIYLFFTRKFRRRAKILSRPFPESWRQILNSRVTFFQRLPDEEKERFEAEVSIFLAEKRITGIGTELDEVTQVLIAASAVIPIFGFQEWEYDNLAEVLVYPDSFDSEFQFGEGRDKNILGLVGSSGALNRLMILSKSDLHRSFDIDNDGHNVGIHEFAHLIDGADGEIDGVPAAACPDCAMPWVDLVRREMDRLARGKSILSRYGLKNPSEFFAVASEVFFSTPQRLRKKHPELYQMLERIFHQDARSLATGTLSSMMRPYPRALKKNGPCPCGQKRKLKDCCLKTRIAGRR